MVEVGLGLMMCVLLAITAPWVHNFLMNFLALRLLTILSLVSLLCLVVLIVQWVIFVSKDFLLLKHALLVHTILLDTI